MKWIKYQYVCNVLNEGTENEEVILLEKKIGYSEANLVIAQKEAYNGEYEIIEDSEAVDIEPLAIELGGTGANTAAGARTKLGLDSVVSLTKIYDQVPNTTGTTTTSKSKVLSIDLAAGLYLLVHPISNGDADRTTFMYVSGNKKASYSSFVTVKYNIDSKVTHGNYFYYYNNETKELSVQCMYIQEQTNTPNISFPYGSNKLIIYKIF